MSRMRHGVALGVSGGAIALGIAAFGACADPTEITVRVATDLPCNALSTRITGGRETAETTQCTAGPRAGIQDIGSIVLVPSGAKNDPLTITVVTAFGKAASACDPNGDPACIVARRKLRYVRHTPLDLPIDMRAACLGKVCDADSTCELGVCVAANVDNPALGAEQDAASTFDGGVFVDAGTDAPVNAAVDAAPDAPPIVDASLDAEGGPPPLLCKPSTLVTNIPQTTADIARLEVTTTGIYWSESGSVSYLAFSGARVSLASLGKASRFAATSTALYYAPQGATGVMKVGLPFGSSAPVPVQAGIAVEALYAAEGATDNPFYTDEVNVYAKGQLLFPLAPQVGVIGSEIIATTNDVWVTLGGWFYRGPRTGTASVVTPKHTLANATFHDLGTNGIQVAWLSVVGSSTLTYQYYEIATDTAKDVPTSATHLGFGLRAYDDDPAGDLVQEPPGYPVGTGIANLIDPGPVVGRIVARDDCIYFWAKNATTGAFEIRSVPPR